VYARPNEGWLSRLPAWTPTLYWCWCSEPKYAESVFFSLSLFFMFSN